MLFCLALAGVLFVAQTLSGGAAGADDVGGAGRRPGQAGVGVLRRGRRRRSARGCTTWWRSARRSGRRSRRWPGRRRPGGCCSRWPGSGGCRGLLAADATVRGAAGRAADRGGRDAGGGGLGGPPRRRPRPSGVGGRHRCADGVRAAARVGGRLVRRTRGWTGRRAGGGMCWCRWWARRSLIAVIVEASATAQVVGVCWLGGGAGGAGDAVGGGARLCSGCLVVRGRRIRSLAWLSIRPRTPRCPSARCHGSSAGGSTGSGPSGSRGRSPSCRGGRAPGWCS